MRRLTDEIAERPAEDLGAAGGRKHQLHQQLQRRRLAGAVRAEEAEDLARLDLERQAVERAVRALAPEADRVVLRQLVGGKRAGTSRCAATWRAAARRRSPDRRTAAASAPSIFTPLMKKVGVDFTPSCWPSAMSPFTSSSVDGVLRVEVGDLADVARRLAHRRRRHRRLMREEPLLHRLAAVVRARQPHGDRRFARRRVNRRGRRWRCSPGSSG